MFAKNKVPQSLIDAVKQVTENKIESQPEMLNEAGWEKVPTPTGTKVYGSSYGDSKKARKDQTKSSVDDVKEPKKKDIESQKEETGYFTQKLLEREMTGAESRKKERIVMRMKDKQDYFKKKYGKRWKEVMYATATKKAMSEEMVEEENIEENFADEHGIGRDIADKKQKMATASNTGKGKPLHNVAKGLKAFLQGKKEPMESVNVEGEVLDEKASVDMLRGRVHTDKPEHNAHKSSKVDLADREELPKGKIQEPHSTKARSSIEAHDGLPAKVDNLDPKLGTPNSFAVHTEAKDPETSDAFGGQANFVTNGQTSSDEPKKKELSEVSVDEKVIAGTPGWVKSPGKDGVVTDKSGAKHTPMSRARDLARQAFKKVQQETLGSAPNNQTGV